MKLFRKKETSLPTDIVNEKWHTSFSLFQDPRFLPEVDDNYTSSIEHGALSFKLLKKNLFAWTDDPLYRYDNFLLKADVGIDESNGYSSVGFLFRRTEDLSYYYFLVSNRKHYRVDLVLNGTPTCLIDWTPCQEFNPSKFSIIISADGSLLSFYLDGSWLGNVSDDSLEAGGFSFAGQNYDEKDRAVFMLNNIEIESRPVHLERLREKLLPSSIPVESRLAFAESRLRSGHYSAALIEIKKVLPSVNNDPAALMMAADCCVNLEMYSEALNLLEKVSADDRAFSFYMQKAGLLYLMNDFIGLRTLLTDNMELLNDSAAAHNLLGNAEYSLGNWERAAAAYRKAFSLEEGQALFAFNCARALHRSGCKEDAAELYGNAARLYFRAGEYGELEGVLPFLEELDESNPETMSLKAKLLFQDGDFKAASGIFNKLIKDDKADSTVYYLNALIEAQFGHSRKASNSFKKALELEPGYHLYYFKFAEFLFLKGDACEQYLDKAIELAPEDPWIQNLSGLVMIERAEYEAACEFFRKAQENAPEEDEIRINYSEALFLSGRIDEALKLLSGENVDVLNQRGNIHSRLNDFPAAVEAYEAAHKADHARTDIMLNLAAASIETDAFSRAEELLVRVLDSGDSGQAYNLLGNLASLKGEYSRAEAAFRKAVETVPGYIDAVCNLAELYMNREKLNDAEILLGGLKVKEPGERYTALKKRLYKLRMSVYRCSNCGEEWVVPKKLPEQPALQLVGEPPDNMPGGKCVECGKIYCIGCVKDKLSEGRLVCLDCGARLKLSEDWMRYLYHQQDY